MNKASFLVVLAVTAVHASAFAWLGTSEPQPPVLQSAPPLYGALIAAAESPEPEPQSRSEPEPKPQPKPQPEPEPEPQPEPSVEETSPKPEATEQGDAEEDIPQVIPPRIDARARANPPPEYPYASRRAQEEGTVLLTVRIDERGRVVSQRVKKSSGFSRLDQAALEAVRHWRYEPARRNGRPIAYDYLQPVVFSLTQ